MMTFKLQLLQDLVSTQERCVHEFLRGAVDSADDIASGNSPKWIKGIDPYSQGYNAVSNFMWDV